ncbi:MAG: glutamate formimidoyltransferase [Nitrospirales bacterium]|nr:glutamate formimidoyltransferase [Nitrospira sp.]MDR4501423.1 glutamate formimidoyltransferase [Nitrospirales bacterium]
MNQIVECVPNISEGRDRQVIESFIELIQGESEVHLLDHHSDVDHHRTVFTIAGRPDAMRKVAYELVRRSIELIDLSKHRGVHPRVGSVDVVPFVPIRGISMEDCVELARQLGARIGSELAMPVFLYGQASFRGTPRRLEQIRQGGWSSLSERMRLRPEWIPDFGPARLHSKAGAVAVGARDYLIAYNVLLQTADVAIAQDIARAIRTSGGGLPSVKALGLELKSRGLTQVSMNLTNYRETSLNDVYRAIHEKTQYFGVDIEESELVGLVPQAALPPEWIIPLKFKHWNPDQILEARLAQVGRM